MNAIRKGTLSQLVTELERQKNNSMDIVVASTAIEAYGEKDKIVLRIAGDGEHALTESAHKQLAEKMGIPQAYYGRMREADRNDLLADNINAWMPSKEKRLVRILDGDIRAILSDKYRPIDNYDLVFKMLDTIKPYKQAGQEIEIISADLTESRMYLRMKMPSTVATILPGDDIIPMLSLSNSETGMARMGVALGLYRLICTNGMMGENIVERVHLGAKLEMGVVQWSEGTLKANDSALFSQIGDTIKTAFEPKLWDDFVALSTRSARNLLPATPLQIVEDVSPHYDIGKKEQDMLLEMFAQEIATPAGKSQWGFANAVTRLARDVEDADRQTELEVIGGEIMMTEPSKMLSMIKVVA